jgi:hypothetical protein
MDILLQVVSYERRGYPPALLADLWNERTKMVRDSGVPSARIILKLIVDENRRLIEDRTLK